MNITNETIIDFLIDQARGDVTDFGYLIIPDDDRLNAEALSLIKKKWKVFIDERSSIVDSKS